MDEEWLQHPQGTQKGINDLIRHIQNATEQSTKWSKPNRKAKGWWTKDMSIPKFNLTNTRTRGRSVLAGEELKNQEKSARKALRKAICDQK